MVRISWHASRGGQKVYCRPERQTLAVLPESMGSGPSLPALISDSLAQQDLEIRCRERMRSPAGDLLLDLGTPGEDLTGSGDTSKSTTTRNHIQRRCIYDLLHANGTVTTCSTHVCRRSFAISMDFPTLDQEWGSAFLPTPDAWTVDIVRYNRRSARL